MRARRSASTRLAERRKSASRLNSAPRRDREARRGRRRGRAAAPPRTALVSRRRWLNRSAIGTFTDFRIVTRNARDDAMDRASRYSSRPRAAASRARRCTRTPRSPTEDCRPRRRRRRRAWPHLAPRRGSALARPAPPLRSSRRDAAALALATWRVARTRETRRMASASRLIPSGASLPPEDARARRAPPTPRSVTVGPDERAPISRTAAALVAVGHPHSSRWARARSSAPGAQLLGASPRASEGRRREIVTSVAFADVAHRVARERRARTAVADDKALVRGIPGRRWLSARAGWGSAAAPSPEHASQLYRG